MARYSVALSNKLRARLFLPRVFRDSKARYDPRSDADEELARKTWAVHGVCLQCRCWTITVGRCPECSLRYSSGSAGKQRDAEIAWQIDFAASLC